MFQPEIGRSSYYSYLWYPLLIQKNYCVPGSQSELEMDLDMYDGTQHTNTETGNTGNIDNRSSLASSLSPH